MTADVAAARAAIGQAVLARDEAALRAIADSLPALTAYAYERHRARAFANALRGAHDSAVAELCLGVAACPPAASTFVADSAQIRLLTDGLPPAPARRTRAPAPAVPRLLASGAALAAAVAALVVLPGQVFEDTRPGAAGITAPTRTARPQVVVAEAPRTQALPRRGSADGGSDASDAASDVATLVAVSSVAPAAAGSLQPATVSTEAPAPRAAVSKPRARPAPPRPAPPSAPQAPAPAPPSEPAPAPPPAAPGPSASVASAPATTAPPAATSPARPSKGKALGRAGAPGRSKGEAARPAETPATMPPAAAPAVEAPAAPPNEASPAGPPEPHPGRGHGRERRP